MQATYDSRTGKLTTRGNHGGTPRFWTVQVRASGVQDVITFRPRGKCRLTDLTELIADTLLAEGADGKEVRWTATAR